LRRCLAQDRYLLAAGVHNPQLLPAPPADGDSSSSSAAEGAASVSQQHHGGPNLLERLVGTVAGALDRAGAAAGNALASMGNWLRHQLRVFQGNGEPRAEESETGADGAGADGQGYGQRTASQVSYKTGCMPPSPVGNSRQWGLTVRASKGCDRGLL
jgi:hypothetical protein